MRVSLFEHDYDDLARQIQSGLERIAVNFLRTHGARVKQDLVDFHGTERVKLELSHGGHTLKVHQVGKPRGPGVSSTDETPGPVEEIFDSTFDGWPAVNTPAEEIASWLQGLPLGEAPADEAGPRPEVTNPFASEAVSSAPTLSDVEPSLNPFLSEQARGPGPNPFADRDRDRKRQEILRRLRGEEDE
jgi:hypothetical protein